MKKIFAFLASLLLLAGCSTTSSAKNLDTMAFAKKIAEPHVVVLDVRTPGEYMSGHIQGAINIDVETSHFESEITKLDKSATYAVYCRSGRRSGVAVETMHHFGFTKLFNLSSGVNDWLANGMALVTN